MSGIDSAPPRSASEVAVQASRLRPVTAGNPELLAPLARAVHHAHCPVCQAPVMGVEVEGPKGPRVQISCFGSPAHAFFFETASGHIANLPEDFGEVFDT